MTSIHTACGVRHRHLSSSSALYVRSTGVLYKDGLGPLTRRKKKTPHLAYTHGLRWPLLDWSTLPICSEFELDHDPAAVLGDIVLAGPTGSRASSPTPLDDHDNDEYDDGISETETVVHDDDDPLGHDADWAKKFDKGKGSNIDLSDRLRRRWCQGARSALLASELPDGGCLRGPLRRPLE